VTSIYALLQKSDSSRFTMLCRVSARALSCGT